MEQATEVTIVPTKMRLLMIWTLLDRRGGDGLVRDPGREGMIDRHYTRYALQRCNHGASVLRGAKALGPVSCIPLGADHHPRVAVLRTKKQP